MICNKHHLDCQAARKPEGCIYCVKESYDKTLCTHDIPASEHCSKCDYEPKELEVSEPSGGASTRTPSEIMKGLCPDCKEVSFETTHCCDYGTCSHIKGKPQKVKDGTGMLCDCKRGLGPCDPGCVTLSPGYGSAYNNFKLSDDPKHRKAMKEKGSTRFLLSEPQWAKEFDEKFIIDPSYTGELAGNAEEIKSFIKEIISQEVAKLETDILCEVNATGKRDFKNGSVMNLKDKWIESERTRLKEELREAVAELPIHEHYGDYVLLEDIKALLK